MKLKKSKKYKKIQSCIKSGLYQFLFLQQKIKRVDLMAIFIIFLNSIMLLLLSNNNNNDNNVNKQHQYRVSLGFLGEIKAY